jgi:hypothetical protein
MVPLEIAQQPTAMHMQTTQQPLLLLACASQLAAYKLFVYESLAAVDGYGCKTFMLLLFLLCTGRQQPSTAGRAAPSGAD